VIVIKKILVIIVSILAILFISILGFFLTTNSEVEQPTTTEEVTNEEIDDDNEEITEEETESVVTNEDPVREFLSEKLKKAVRNFFQRDLYVVSIGDSLTEGVGDDKENGGYVGVLEETINQEEQLVTIENFGRRGNRTDQLIKRLEEEEDVIKAVDQADIIFITIGANDIMQVFKDNFTNLNLDQFTSEQIRYEQRLNKIFSTLQEINPDATIYLIGFYNPFREYFPDIEELEYIVDSWNQIGLDVTGQYEHIHYIPIKDLFEDPYTEFFADDNFHPNHIGYKKIAERILNYLTNEGEDNAFQADQ